MLKFNLEKGKTYEYDINWNMDQKIEDKESKINISGLYSINVVEENNGVRTLSCTYEAFRMYMKMLGMELDIDTDKPARPLTAEEIQQDPTGLISRIFLGIKGKTFQMEVDPEGKVVAVKGVQQIINSMLDSVEVDRDMKLQMNASLSDQFNEQNIKDQFAQVFDIFPNKAVKVGDSWPKNFQTGGRMPAKYSTNFVVRQIDGHTITLSSASKITPVDSGGSMQLNGEQTGTLLVDANSGLVVNAEFDQNMITKMQGMQIQTRGKGKSRGKQIN